MTSDPAGDRGEEAAGDPAGRHPRWRAMRDALRRPHVRSALRITFSGVIVGLVIWLVLIPQFRAGEGSIERLLHASPLLIAAAVLAQGLSLLVFSLLTWVILGRGVPFPRLFAIDLADLAANHTLPGGGATAAALRFRLLRANGISAERALSVAAVETLISNLGLGVVFLSGVLSAIGRSPISATVWTAAAVVLAAGIAVVAVMWTVARHPRPVLAAAGWIERRIRIIPSGRLRSFAQEGGATVTSLLDDRPRAARAAIAAIGNWALDAATLWIVLGAFGAWAHPGALLIAYGLGTVLSQLPLTPGGLGLVEAATTLALVGSGVEHGAAVLGVLGWRVLEFWLPVPIGWICYLALGATRSRRRQGARP